MLRKRFLSLTCALVLCLGLLPATALAAGEATTVYVGGKTLTGSADSPAYATTNDDTGEVTVLEAAPSDNQWNIKWDGSTLTLNGAKIKGADSSESLSATVGIYAFNSSGDVSLNIALKGVNEIFESSNGIWVYSSSTNAGNATLTIEGEGSLNASGGTNGIQVQSNSGNAALTIQNADVTAENSSYSGDGVTVRAGSSSSASLSVDGGSLTATGKNENGAGIRYTFGSSSSGSGKPSLNVSGNTIVRANGGIANNSSTSIQYGTGNEENSGIVFDGNEGTVYGSVTLQEDLTIGEGESLTLDDGASLAAGDHNVIVDGGTLGEGFNLGDSVKYTPTITTENLPGGTVLTPYSQTLSADGTAPIIWSIAEGSSLPTGLSLNGNTISGTPTAAGTYSFTVTATNDYGSDSKEFTLTIDQQGTIHVTSVSLDKANLELTEGETAQLTATVLPDNATNKNVTWSTSNASIATVDANGEVTAVSAGTATITVTTADGGKTATCTVTVTRPYIPPANPNYRITLEATQGGAVTADPTAAKAGTTVTLTPVPDRGYQVGSVAVTDRFGEAVAVTENADGTYTFTMPNGQVSVNVTFVEMEAEPLPFTDVNEGDWFHDAVRYVYDNGLMDGVGDGQFAPNATTNRAMVVTILYRLAGEPDVSGDVAFTDVEPGLWYSNAVAWAAQKGIVNGVSETEFSPSGDLTREQLATILFRYAESAGYDVSASADLSGFPDAGDIQSYATQALSWAVAEGLLQGFEDDTIRPGGTATRAQIATILMRFCEGVGA